MTANPSASIRRRLLNLARQEEVSFNQILNRYGIERLLYRLSVSEESKNFVLKGAQLLRVWHLSAFRPTRDIDFLGFTENSLENLTQILRRLCEASVEIEDGLNFLPETIEAERIKEDADYEGVRLRVRCMLDTANIPLQIDIGFNDVVTPEATDLQFPTLLDHPAPLLRGYSPETVLAEKIEAMVSLGERNSRMKDFYDILLLSRTQTFSQALLRKAVANTFAQRETVVPTELPILLRETHPVLTQKQTQWAAFVRKNKLDQVPTAFDEVAKELRTFVAPILQVATEANEQTWSPDRGWK